MKDANGICQSLGLGLRLKPAAHSCSRSGPNNGNTVSGAAFSQIVPVRSTRFACVSSSPYD